MISNTLVASSFDGGAMSASMRLAHRSSITRSDGFTLRLSGGPPALSHLETVAGW
jgi:hypothetical protein